MARNYQNELAWQKEKYKRIAVYLDRTLAEEFKDELKKRNMTMADWVRAKIEQDFGLTATSSSDVESDRGE